MLTSTVNVLPHQQPAIREFEPGTESARGSPVWATHVHVGAEVLTRAYPRVAVPPARSYPSAPCAPCHDPCVVTSVPAKAADPPPAGGTASTNLARFSRPPVVVLPARAGIGSVDDL